MKEKFKKLTSAATAAVSNTAQQTRGLVQANRPSDANIAKAKNVAVSTGKAALGYAAAMGKEIARSKTLKDAVKGAGLGAVAAVPLPLVGPLAGAVVGAGAGVYLGLKSQPDSAPALPLPVPAVDAGDSSRNIIDVVATVPFDLNTKLRELDQLRVDGLLNDEEFQSEKRKLLARS